MHLYMCARMPACACVHACVCVHALAKFITALKTLVKYYCTNEKNTKANDFFNGYKCSADIF